MRIRTLLNLALIALFAVGLRTTEFGDRSIRDLSSAIGDLSTRSGNATYDSQIAKVPSLPDFGEFYRSLVRRPEVQSKLQSVSEDIRSIERIDPASLDRVRHNNLDQAIKRIDSDLTDATDVANSAGTQLLNLHQITQHEDGLAYVAQTVRDNWMMLPFLGALTLVGFLLWCHRPVSCPTATPERPRAR